MTTRDSNCFFVKMYNGQDCELDSRIAKTLEDAKIVLLDMIGDAVLDDGDSFKVEPGWSEQFAA